MKSLSVNNEKVLSFYRTHPSLDFEKVNILIVELLENIIDTKSLDNILAKQIVDNFDNIKQLMVSNKNEYLDNLKNILQVNTSNSNENIQRIIKDESESIKDKTKLVLSECIPKNNESISSIVSLTEHRIRDSLNELKFLSTSNTDKQSTLLTDVNTLIHKMDSTVGKGKLSENSLELILNNLYPTAEIINSSKNKESADYILRRENIHDIRFENKNYNQNVPTKEILKFKKDMELNNSSGVMLCQNHGITSKNNFEFEIFNGNVYIYLHYVNYDPDKIRTAVDIIDNLKLQFKNTASNQLETIFMDNALFAKINAEIIKNIERRDNLVNTIKKNTDRMVKDLRDIDFPILRDFIAINSGSTESKKFICEYCGKIPEKNNIKALQTHYRFCKEKQSHEQHDSDIGSETFDSE